MKYIKKLVSILKRNENWLLSKILTSARENNKPGFEVLINHSWKPVIDGFAEIINLQSDSNFSQSDNLALYEFPENEFINLGTSEAEKCSLLSVKPEVYLAFQKKVRKIYIELISDSSLNVTERNQCITFLNNCFDAFEIAFVSKLFKTNTVEKKLETGNTDKILIENLSFPVLIINPFHKIIKFNKEASLLFPFLNENSTLRFDGDALNSKIDEFRISKNKERIFETTLSLNNKLFFLLVGLSKIQDSGNILISIVDLSRWKETEEKLRKSKLQAEKANDLKTAFLANMSHEIRTPLNAIVGFAELLTITNPGEAERAEYFNLIKKSSNDLLNIIEDIIDIAKIESKQLKIIQKNLSPYELLTDLGKVFSELLTISGKGKINLIINVREEEKNLIIQTDPKRLKQVLSNLIGNAIKFTEKGQIEIGYKVAESKLVYFFVKDTGVGIPSNMQKKIFDRFVQVEDTYHKNSNGTGLGLAICKNIVNLLGGNIWVSSLINKGSIFYFYIPLKTSSETEYSPVKKEAVVESNTNLSKYCILIAEDEDTNFYYLREALKSTGINIIRAKNGLEAINQVESNDNINIVLMDIKMPEVSGLEAARYIAHIKPKLPIIALTAFAMDNDRQTCLDAGCIDYLAKPITHDKLVSVVKKYIAKKNLQKANSPLI